MTFRLRARRIAGTTLLLLTALISFVQTGAQQRPVRERLRTPSQTGAQAPAQSNATVTTPRPRLVLLLVVDQFRYDYLERFGDLFVTNGINRLRREGASWTEANYDHMPTYTAPGHAALMTGTWPAENGVIANDWFDRDTGKNVTSVSDDTARLLDGKEGEKASSPRRLLASTLGDELRLATNDRAKVIGISVKDRSAILPAGRHASAAYWFSTQSGRMVSSNYYFNQLPGWVTRFNETRPADKYFGARWDRLLSEAEYVRRAGPDAPSWEDVSAVKDTNTFPHMITGGASAPGKDFYEALDFCPFSNDLLVSFAEEAITNEALGADDDTDFLSVSFSANDYVGHRFGPYSQEAMDLSLRVDRQIAALLDFIEAHVGLRNTLVAFTADHGVAPIPEHASALGLTGGRIKNSDVLNAVRGAIRARYARGSGAQDSTADYVQSFINGNIYFNTVALKRDGINREELEQIAGEAAMTVPGITRYFTRTQLEKSSFSFADPVARRVFHGFHPRRSGDVIVVGEPFKFLVSPTDTSITTHGTPYSYDTHVPLIIMGRHVVAGRYIQAATPADIAPTLAAILRVQAPSNATGRVLIEGIENSNK